VSTVAVTMIDIGCPGVRRPEQEGKGDRDDRRDRYFQLRRRPRPCKGRRHRGRSPQALRGDAGPRNKFFTVDAEGQRALNFYAWESDELAKQFFDDALLERVTGLYGVRPTVEFFEIAEIVDNT
jgi:hypothetical protein